ncbi:MAG: hypothetical protein R2911_33165 [Caldilineaceae bacterium]
MDSNGGNMRRLTNNAANDDSPTWSPDSQQIAFTSDRGGNSDIFIINVDGSNEHNITNSPADDLCPAWHIMASSAP